MKLDEEELQNSLSQELILLEKVIFLNKTIDNIRHLIIITK